MSRRSAPRTRFSIAFSLSTAALATFGATSAVAQSAGCAAIDGFSSSLVPVRVTEILTNLSFDEGETVTLNADSVTSSQSVGTLIWAFADASASIGFGEGAISSFFASSDTAISETVEIPSGGIGGLALTETGAFSTDLNNVTISCLMAISGGGADGPDPLVNLSASANVAGRLAIQSASRIAGARGQSSLDTRGAVLSFASNSNPENGSSVVAASSMNGAKLIGGLYTWLDLTGFRAEDDSTDRTFTGRGVQLGADMAVMSNMVVGLSLGAQEIESRIATVQQDGVLRFAQPYMAYVSGDWAGQTSLIYGEGDYTQTSTAGIGKGDTELSAITFNGSYDIALEKGITVTPMLGVTRGVERSEGVSGTLAGTGSEKVRFTEISLGGEVSYAMRSANIFAGLHADWLDTDTNTTLVSDLLIDDGWTGRVELGLSTAMGNGITFDASVEVSGLGGDLQNTGGSLRVAYQF